MTVTTESLTAIRLAERDISSMAESSPRRSPRRKVPRIASLPTVKRSTARILAALHDKDVFRRVLVVDKTFAGAKIAGVTARQPIIVFTGTQACKVDVPRSVERLCALFCGWDPTDK